jgi:hypothetical protein
MKELPEVCWEMFRETGAMLKQEDLRVINRFAAAGGSGASTGNFM